jgi:hypothetical protein
MPMLPHSFAIFRQQDFSCSVSCAFGIKHAIAGTPSNTRSTAAATALLNSFILVKVYPSEPGRAMNPLSDEITKGTGSNPGVQARFEEGIVLQQSLL